MSLQKVGKVFAVFSAILLGGCYVGYRALEHAKVEPNVKEDPYAPTVLPSSKNPGRTTVLPGSKSIDAILKSPSRKFAEDAATKPEARSEAGKATLLPSSKVTTGILRQEDAKVIEKEVNSILDGKESESQGVPPP